MLVSGNAPLRRIKKARSWIKELRSAGWRFVQSNSAKPAVMHLLSSGRPVKTGTHAYLTVPLIARPCDENCKLKSSTVIWSDILEIADESPRRDCDLAGLLAMSKVQAVTMLKSLQALIAACGMEIEAEGK